MTSKLDKLRAQRQALDAAIKIAEAAERAASRAARQRAIFRVVDQAIANGASTAEIEAAIASLTTLKLAQPMPETGVVNHG